MRKKFIEVNLFKHYPSTDRQIRHQRYATRLYILLICISIAILTIYTLSKKPIQSKRILSPSQSEYIELERDYSHSLLCPCTSISIPYSTFITLQPDYHQLCLSQFVSPQWISYTNDLRKKYSFFMDYRGSATVQFQALLMFCKEARQTIDDALRVFSGTQFVSLQVISPQTFEFQIKSLIQNWKSITINTFMRTIQLFRAMIQGNQLSNGGFNSRASINASSRKTTIQARSYSNCSCALSRSCRVSTNIYDLDKYPDELIEIYPVPNFFVGCYPIEALLASTLECFYDLACMMNIHNLSNMNSKPFLFSALDKNLSQSNETIELIVNRLMVDTWFSNFSFSLYYDKCAPPSCSYEFIHRHNFAFVITTIASVYGGLSLGLHIIIWLGLRFVEQIIENGVSTLVVCHSIKRIVSFQNKHKIIRRLHFIFLITMLSIYYTIIAFNPSTETIEIKNITLSIYTDLLTQSHESLYCPCSQMSIKYKLFLDIQPRFHQVCSSDFISHRWISYLYNLTLQDNQLNSTDFYYSASGQFQLLTSLCQLSQETVNHSLFQLGESDFINSQLLSPNLLEKRIQATMNEFESTMPNLFINSLSLIRETIEANMLTNVFSTNWMIETPSEIISLRTTNTIPLDYQECNCAWSSKCVSSSRSMLAGCYPIETILQSTLECLFIPNCINSTDHFKAMNVSLVNSSRFSLNTTIESIVNKLMVEEFLNKTSYELYFSLCSPLSCTYSDENNNNRIEKVTTLIGLYGGLSIICRILSILIVKQFLCWTQRVGPITN